GGDRGSRHGAQGDPRARSAGARSVTRTRELRPRGPLRGLPMRARFRRQRELAGALCVLAALCALPRTTPADDTKPLTAILIKATAGLSDPFFADSVVLVMNNLGPAPVGIVINRPTPLPVARLFPDLKRLAEVPDHVYFGGPVEVESV